jgi:hypothetical protein
MHSFNIEPAKVTLANGNSAQPVLYFLLLLLYKVSHVKYCDYKLLHLHMLYPFKMHLCLSMLNCKSNTPLKSVIMNLKWICCMDFLIVYHFVMCVNCLFVIHFLCNVPFLFSCTPMCPRLIKEFVCCFLCCLSLRLRATVQSSGQSKQLLSSNPVNNCLLFKAKILKGFNLSFTGCFHGL